MLPSTHSFSHSVLRQHDLDRVRDLERQITHVEAEIDRRIHALCRLTEEEIKIVDGGKIMINLTAPWNVARAGPAFDHNKARMLSHAVSDLVDLRTN